MWDSFKNKVSSFVYTQLLSVYEDNIPNAFLLNEHIPKNSLSFKIYTLMLKQYSWIIRSLQASPETVHNLVQERRLKKLICSAQKSIWWKGYFETHGFHSIQTLSDLKKLPPITRSDIIDVPKKNLLIEDNDESRVVWRPSGGSTTGIPIVWGVAKTSLILNNAANLIRVFEDHRFLFDEVKDFNFHTSFNYYPPKERLDFKWFSEDDFRIIRKERGNPTTLNQTLRDFCTFAQSTHGKAVLRIYPSELRFLMTSLREKGFRPSLGFIVLVGNTLEPTIRSIAEEYFRCPITVYYGTQELGSIGIECQSNPGKYHVLSERAVVEILDTNKEVVPYGSTGNITITCLDNIEMPLIRYEVGDIGILHATNKCICNNNSPLLEIEGRTSDFVRFPDGRKISAHIALRYFNRPAFVESVRRFQVRQEKIDLLQILLELREAIEPQEIQDFQKLLELVYGPQIKIEIKIVNEIPSTINTKFKVFVPLAIN